MCCPGGGSEVIWIINTFCLFELGFRVELGVNIVYTRRISSFKLVLGALKPIEALRVTKRLEASIRLNNSVSLMIIEHLCQVFTAMSIFGLGSHFALKVNYGSHILL